MKYIVENTLKDWIVKVEKHEVAHNVMLRIPKPVHETDIGQQAKKIANNVCYLYTNPHTIFETNPSIGSQYSNDKLTIKNTWSKFSSCQEVSTERVLFLVVTVSSRLSFGKQETADPLQS